MGRAGTVNVLLDDWFDVARPINFVYGLHGVLLVETLHLFPMITLNVRRRAGQDRPRAGGGGRERGRPRLDEAAHDHAAADDARATWPARCSSSSGPSRISPRRWCSASTTCWPSQAYLNIVQFVDRRLFRMGIVISALMVALAVVFLVAARRYVAIKDYSSLSYSRVARRRLSPLGQARRDRLPVAGDARCRSSRTSAWRWPRSARAGRSRRSRCSYTLQYFERVIVETPKYIVNSFLYSGLAVAGLHRGRRADRLDPGPHARARPRHARRPQHADPGHPRAPPSASRTSAPSTSPLPGFDRELTSLWIVLPLVLAHPPAALHGARLLRLAAARAPLDGGSRGQRRRHGACARFRDVTLPLIWRGVLVGSLFSFMTSLQEASAVLFLSLGGWETITGRHLLLLHRRQRQRGRRARRHPHRGRRRERCSSSTASPGARMGGMFG